MAGIGALGGLEMGMLFHAMISSIRGEGDAGGKRRLGNRKAFQIYFEARWLPPSPLSGSLN
jgi:hypothetical protein